MGSNSKFWIGLLMCISGAFLGLYVGFWLCFVGGIVDVLTQFKSVDTNALAVALGIAKVFFSGIAGWGSAFLLIIPGSAFIQAS